MNPWFPMKKVILPILIALLVILIPAISEAGSKKSSKTKKSSDRYPGGAKNDKLCDDQNGPRGEYCKMIVEELTKTPEVVQLVDQVRASSIKGMDEFCPTFDQRKNDRDWAVEYFKNLIATIITTESNWDPKNVYREKDGTESKGLCQLTAKTDHSKGGKCSQLTDGNILDAKANIACCVQMVMSYMAKDKEVGSGKTDKDAKGIAISFGPFRDHRKKDRKPMADRTTAWCNGAGAARDVAGSYNLGGLPTAQ